MNTNKSQSLSLILVAAALLAAPLAHAQGPCKKAREKVRAACEAAGFREGGQKEGKGLHKDCMRKIMHGESVPGVSLGNDADVAACQKKRAERGERLRQRAQESKPESAEKPAAPSKN